MELQPLYDKIVVRRDETPDRTESGLYLPGEGERPTEGIVLSVGEGVPLDNADGFRRLLTSVGDRVLFGKYAGTEVSVNGEDLLILREEDILAIVRE